MFEPPRTSAKTPSIPCNDVEREGPVRPNHLELMRQNPTHLAICSLMWVEKVR